MLSKGPVFLGEKKWSRVWKGGVHSVSVSVILQIELLSLGKDCEMFPQKISNSVHSCLTFGQIHKHTLTMHKNHILSTQIELPSPHQIPFEISCRTALREENLPSWFLWCPKTFQVLGYTVGKKIRHFPSLHLPITDMSSWWAAMVNIFYSEFTKRAIFIDWLQD